MTPPGRLTVITGPMFSNKSGELLRLAEVYRIAGRTVGLFKHGLDDRYTGAAQISTHGGQAMDAEPVSMAAQIALLATSYEVVAIDEAQFFDTALAGIVRDLVERGTIVLVAGLDRNFKGDPFGPLAELLALADDVMKLRAVCMVCRSLDATMTQRLIDGRPATAGDPEILIGAAEHYEARCRRCHELPDDRR
ncbi:MAG: thymidine kinase [Candidatus Dormiibacterota bacterium]